MVFFHLLLNVVLLWAREYSWGECRPAQGPCPVTRHMCSPLVARLPLYLQLDQCTVSQLVTGTSRQACPLPMGLLPELTVEQRLPKGFHLLRWEVLSVWTGDRLEAGGHIIRDSRVLRPSLLSSSHILICKAEAGPACFTSDSCAWNGLCPRMCSVSGLLNLSVIDI